jgi:hypothetical protein
MTGVTGPVGQIAVPGHREITYASLVYSTRG